MSLLQPHPFQDAIRVRSRHGDLESVQFTERRTQRRGNQHRGGGMGDQHRERFAIRTGTCDLLTGITPYPAYPRGGAVQQRAGLGGGHVAFGVPHEQRGARHRLQGGDARGHRGLRDLELVGRNGELPGLIDGDQRLQLGHVALPLGEHDQRRHRRHRAHHGDGVHHIRVRHTQTQHRRHEGEQREQGDRDDQHLDHDAHIHLGLPERGLPITQREQAADVHQRQRRGDRADRVQRRVDILGDRNADQDDQQRHDHGHQSGAQQPAQLLRQRCGG